MHETMIRLYEAARIIRNVAGQTNVAGLLHQSPQVVKNWETRGISKQGALTAEKFLGIRPAWLLRDEGPMLAGAALAANMAASSTVTAHLTTGPAPPTLAAAIERLGAAMAEIPERTRRTVLAQLEGLVTSPHEAREVAIEIDLLIQSSKRRSA